MHVGARYSSGYKAFQRFGFKNLVGGEGFEPSASRSRTVRAAKLRQPPTGR